MSTESTVVAPPPLARLGIEQFPAVIIAAGEPACRRFLEFFTAQIRNRNTDMAYARAVVGFLEWCEAQGWRLEHIEPRSVATYLEQLQGDVSAATVKQHRAVIRRFFDWLVLGQVLRRNPARSARGPRQTAPHRQGPR